MPPHHVEAWLARLYDRGNAAGGSESRPPESAFDPLRTLSPASCELAGFDASRAMISVEDRFASELDARHEEGRAAFHDRDADAYSDLFSASLRYEQHDGEIIGRSKLMSDVQAQFRRMDRAGSSFTREHLSVEGGLVSETLVQNAFCEASEFGVLRRRWDLRRQGLYSWAMEDGQWRIVHVRVLDEQLRNRWKLGS